jgi:polar amino acid transport system permease protein
VGYTLNFTLVLRQLPRLFEGLLLSLELTAVSVLVGAAIGLTLALLRGRSAAMRIAITAYVEIIRNTPLLLLVYFVFYAVPSATGLVIDAIPSFVVTLSLYAGAYMVEVFRAGLDAVPTGLVDAGLALGLAPLQVLRLVRIPVMLRTVLPSLGNTVVSVFKDTSLASVIAVPELMFGAQWINFNTFRIIEIYLVVTPMYLVVSYVLLFALRMIEHRYRWAH